MTRLSFGDRDLEVPDNAITLDVESGNVRRAEVRGTGHLDGTGTLTFITGHAVTVLWLLAGTRNEVVEGRLPVQLDGVGAHLTPAGLVCQVQWRRTIDVARLISEGERVLPHSVHQVLQTDPSPFRGLAVDWDVWRRWIPGKGKRGSPVSGELSVPLSAGIALVVRPTAVFFEATTQLRLVEEKSRLESAAGKITLRPSDQPTAPGSWSVTLDNVALELAAFDRPTVGLWLRGAEDSWLHLRAPGREPWALREPSVRSESRIAVVPSAPGTLLELLLDHSGSITLDFERGNQGGWKLTQVEVSRPALRLTHRHGGYLAEENSAPELPPCERVSGGRPLTFLSPLLLRSGPVSRDWYGPRFELLSVDEEGAKLGVNSGIFRPPFVHSIEAWRRSQDLPSLDTPPSWALNDQASAERPSRLRGLVPHQLVGSATSILLKDGLASLPDAAWTPSRFSNESGRASYALDADLKREWSDAKSAAKPELRWAVASLDDLYRSSITLDAEGSLVAPDLTYVKGRYKPDASKPDASEPDANEPETSWAPPVEKRVAGGQIRIIEERWSGYGSEGAVRRWAFPSEQDLAGLRLVAESWDGSTLSARPSDDSGVEGRLEIGTSVQGHLRVKADKALEHKGKARWFDLDKVTLEDGCLVAEESFVWHGELPDLVRTTLPGALRIEKAGDEFALHGVPLELVIPHDLGAGVVVTETVWSEKPETAWAESDGFSMEGAAVKHLGSRLLIVSATSHRLEPADIFRGVVARARTRVFLELKRKDDGRLAVVGGLVGWEAGTLFGMQPFQPNQSFPQLTLVWPIDRRGDRCPVLEINGTWTCHHRYGDAAATHDISASFWDVVVPLNEEDGKVSLPESLSLPAVVSHQFPGAQQKAYAFQTAGVRSGLMDLSAVLFAESRAKNMTRESAMPRRGLAGFLVELNPPSRNGVDKPNGALIALVRCGPAFSGGGDETVDPAVSVTGAPLSWQRGVARVTKPHETPELLRLSGTGQPTLHLVGGDLETLRKAEQLSTLTVGGSPEAGWLPCPVLRELDPNERALSTRRARLWIVGAEGLEVLHVFDKKSVERDVAASVIALTGWHREAVLETWPGEQPDDPGEQPTWTLVDSPLLNRSLPLRRFASGARSPAAYLPRDGDDAPSHTPPSNDLEAPALKPPHDAARRSMEWEATLGKSTHFVVHRAVPFERGVPQGLRHGSRSLHPGHLPEANDGGVEGSTERKPWSPGHLVWTPGVPRPGEQVAHAIETRGGSMVQMRFPRWREPTLEVRGFERGGPRDVGQALVEYTYRWLAYRRGPSGREKQRVLLHSPEAKLAHPADPIRVWSFLGDDETFEITITPADKGCTAVVEVIDGDTSRQVAAQASGGALVSTLQGPCAAVIRATGALESVKVTHAGEERSVTLNDKAPRMLSSYGFVGLCSDEEGERVVAFGPEPPAAWWPEAQPNGEVTWYRQIEHVEVVHQSTTPVSSVFYIEPTGVRVTGKKKERT